MPDGVLRIAFLPKEKAPRRHHSIHRSRQASSSSGDNHSLSVSETLSKYSSAGNLILFMVICLPSVVNISKSPLLIPAAFLIEAGIVVWPFDVTRDVFIINLSMKEYQKVRNSANSKSFDEHRAGYRFGIGTFTSAAYQRKHPNDC